MCYTVHKPHNSVTFPSAPQFHNLLKHIVLGTSCLFKRNSPISKILSLFKLIKPVLYCTAMFIID